jgi:transcriptional regulator with XRE-family HTH domain
MGGEMASLGETLKIARQISGRSLKDVADPAHISPAYLQKLEKGQVSNPSPNVLHRLGEQLDLSYVDLMRLAGYVVPSSSAIDTTEENVWAHALRSQELTEEEAQAIAAFLRHLRETKAMNDVGRSS